MCLVEVVRVDCVAVDSRDFTLAVRRRDAELRNLKLSARIHGNRRSVRKLAERGDIVSAVRSCDHGVGLVGIETGEGNSARCSRLPAVRLGLRRRHDISVLVDECVVRISVGGIDREVNLRLIVRVVSHLLVRINCRNMCIARAADRCRHVRNIVADLCRVIALCLVYLIGRSGREVVEVGSAGHAAVADAHNLAVRIHDNVLVAGLRVVSRHNALTLGIKAAARIHRMYVGTEDRRIRIELDEVGLAVCDCVARIHHCAVVEPTLVEVVDLTGVARRCRLNLTPGLVLPSVKRGRNSRIPGDMVVKRCKVNVNPPSRIFLECSNEILAALEAIRILKEVLTAVHDTVVVRIHEPAVEHVVVVVCGNNRKEALCLEVRIGVTLACTVVLQHAHLEGVRAVCGHIRGDKLGRIVCRCHIVVAQGSEFRAAHRVLAAVELDVTPSACISGVTIAELKVAGRHLRSVVVVCGVEGCCIARNRHPHRIVIVAVVDIAVEFRHCERIALNRIIRCLRRHHRRNNVS